MKKKKRKNGWVREWKLKTDNIVYSGVGFFLSFVYRCCNFRVCETTKFYLIVRSKFICIFWLMFNLRLWFDCENASVGMREWRWRKKLKNHIDWNDVLMLFLFYHNSMNGKQKCWSRHQLNNVAQHIADHILNNELIYFSQVIYFFLFHSPFVLSFNCEEETILHCFHSPPFNFYLFHQNHCFFN